MLEISIENIFVTRCYICPEFREVTTKSIDEYKKSSFAYCYYCGGIAKSPDLGMLGKYLHSYTNDIKIINISSHHSVVSVEFRPKYNTLEEIISNLPYKKQICNLCLGQKQIWDNVSKMMKNCIVCQGSGIT